MLHTNHPYRIRALLTVLLCTLSLVVTNPALAQQEGEQNKISAGPRKQLATIIFAGLGGAVLGLSTLSFYGRPQDRLANIAIGFAVGIIVGTVYVTYKAAKSPQEFYGTTSTDGFSPYQFSRVDYLTESAESPTPQLGLSWSF